MTYRESDILWEGATHWALRASPTTYETLRHGATCSDVLATFAHPSLAVAYARYLDKRAAAKTATLRKESSHD